MDFQELKVGDFAYFECLTVSMKLLGRECRRDVMPGTHQNKIHMIYYSFLTKSSMNYMFLEISLIFRLKFKWNYILNLWLSN
jgi:hypothetical protein